jgi:hypothetical protein
VIGNDAFDDRQAESGTLTHLLGGEERLEDSALRRLIHAFPLSLTDNLINSFGLDPFARPGVIMITP